MFRQIITGVKKTAGMKTFLAIALVLFCFAGDAAAGVMAQCVDDAARLCPKVKQKNQYTCLRQHASKLSLACADAVGKGSGNIQTAASCQGDALKICNSRKLNKPTRKCLERNFDRLGPDCKGYFYQLGWGR